MYKKCVVRRFHFTKWEYRRPWKYVTDRSGCWTFLSINDLAGPAGKLSNFLSDKQGGVTHQNKSYLNINLFYKKIIPDTIIIPVAAGPLPVCAVNTARRRRRARTPRVLIAFLSRRGARARWRYITIYTIIIMSTIQPH